MTLRKYCPITVYSLENIAKVQLNLTSPEYFNDPFDCYFIRKINILEISDVELKEKLKKVKILSLCNEDELNQEKDIEKQNYTRRHFWSFYADAHKGICIEFTIPDVEFTKKTSKLYNLKLTPGDFVFSTNLFFCRQVDYDPVFKNLQSIKTGINLADPSKLLETTVFNKDNVFEAEKEFRIGVISNDYEKFPSFDIKEFKPKIIFGLACEEEHKEAIKIIGDNSFSFYQVNENMEEVKYDK